jgi:type IV secretion system protein VirB5
MLYRKVLAPVVFALCMMGTSLTAHAQFAVIDVGAITQLIVQVQTLEQQLQTAQQALSQAQQIYQSTTGNRGMEQLLSGQVRNYLPSSWSQLTAAQNGTGDALGTSITGAMNANAVLSPQQVSQFSPAQQNLLKLMRQSTALRQGLATQSLSTTSNRFNSLQQLITEIGSAGDQKGALELQSRTQSELAMLQNDNTKTQVLEGAVEAQEAAWKLRILEQTIADIGSTSQLPPMGL